MKTSSRSRKRPAVPRTPAVALTYAGAGFLPGIPARTLSLRDLTVIAARLDLSPADLSARLVASGLYAAPPVPPAE